MTRVKICGLMNRRDVDLCVQAGVHILGFVVEYPVHVPWNLTIDTARELIGQAPPFVSTCVVTGGEVGKVLDIVNETCPDVVQLHYKETLCEVKEISQKLKLQGVKVIKALRMDSEGNCDFEITDPYFAVKELEKSGISAILIDSYTASMPGGTGVVVDLTVFKKIQKESSLPVILAGGLTPDNILSIIEQAQPFAVDVLTGVETKPDQKDPEKIKRFLSNVQSGMAETL